MTVATRCEFCGHVDYPHECWRLRVEASGKPWRPRRRLARGRQDILTGFAALMMISGAIEMALTPPNQAFFGLLICVSGFLLGLIAMDAGDERRREPLVVGSFALAMVIVVSPAFVSLLT